MCKVIWIIQTNYRCMSRDHFITQMLHPLESIPSHHCLVDSEFPLIFQGQHLMTSNRTWLCNIHPNDPSWKKYKSNNENCKVRASWLRGQIASDWLKLEKKGRLTNVTNRATVWQFSLIHYPKQLTEQPACFATGTVKDTIKQFFGPRDSVWLGLA